MKSLTEKYRPQKLSDLRGHPNIVRALASFIKSPTAKAFLFDGPAGCGKTSAAYAVARELGCDFTVSPKECGGIYEFASGELLADNVREMFKTSLTYCPFFGSGWKVVIANECDAMSKQTEVIFLDTLEHLPAKTVVIFTTNEPDKLTARFRQRCERHTFKTPVDDGAPGASVAEISGQALIDEVWMTELGHNHSPRLKDLDCIDGGNLSFRSVVQSLEPLIRIQREIDQEEASKAQLTIPALPSGRVSAMAEMEKGRALYASMMAGGGR